MLYKCFVKETVPKYGGKADFSTTILPKMPAYTHAHHCSLFKTGAVKINYVRTFELMLGYT